MTCCTPKCTDSCYPINIDELNNLLYGINEYITRQADKKSSYLFYNYGEGINEKNLYELSRYKKFITKYRDRILREGLQCVCPDNAQTILERVKDIVPKKLCGQEYNELNIDDIGVDAWLLEHPNCSGAAEWEKISYKVCTGLGLTATLTKQQQCDITFDITKNLMSCELLFIVNVVNKACELGYEIKRTKEECKLDWRLLVEKTDCNLNLKEYNTLVSQGLTYDMILQIYSMGASIDVNGNECSMRTSRDTSYTFSELNLRKVPTQEDLNTDNTSCPSLDLQQYISDYQLNQDQINSLKHG